MLKLNYIMLLTSLFTAPIGPINAMHSPEDNNTTVQTREEKHPNVYAIINELDLTAITTLTLNQITRVQKMTEAVDEFKILVQESHTKATNEERLHPEEQIAINALLVNSETETESDYPEESLSSLEKCSELFKKFNTMEQSLIYAENCLALIMKILKTTHTGTNRVMSHITNATQRIQQLSQLEETLKKNTYNLLTQKTNPRRAPILHRAYYKITAVEELLSDRIKMQNNPHNPHQELFLESEVLLSEQAYQQQELATLLAIELSLLNSINHLICIEKLLLYA